MPTVLTLHAMLCNAPPSFYFFPFFPTPISSKLKFIMVSKVVLAAVLAACLGAVGTTGDDAAVAAASEVNCVADVRIPPCN